METIVKIRDIQEEAGGEWVGYEVQTTEGIIRLAIGNHRRCCESWGFFWCNDNPQEFVGAEVLDVTLTDTALDTRQVKRDEANSLDEGGIMFVNIETDRGKLQFVAYNTHNGYYGHAAKVESRQLAHNETL